MPVTFLAHQAPVLPFARRWPQRFDGVALVVGSMAPDFAYVLNGSRFAVWAHGWPGLFTFCVPATFIVSWVLVRVLAPIVPCHLPQAGSFRLRDYRGLATHRFGLVRTSISALVGAITHVALDHLTHEWGWFARNIDWFQRPIIQQELLGRTWTPFRVAQYLGHVVLSAVAIWWLWRQGAQRWLSTRADRIDCRQSTFGTLLLIGGAVLGGATATAWVLIDRAGSATDIMRVAAGAFVGLTAAAVVARRRAAG